VDNIRGLLILFYSTSAVTQQANIFSLTVDMKNLSNKYKNLDRFDYFYSCFRRESGILRIFVVFQVTLTNRYFNGWKISSRNFDSCTNKPIMKMRGMLVIPSYPIQA